MIARRFSLALVALMSVAAFEVGAVDTPPSDQLPDLAAIRAHVYSGDYAKAVSELEELQKTVRHADVFNLLGFSLRNLGRYEEADRWYREALYFDPTHRQAIEYQGELYVKTGQIEKAKENLTTLQIFCHPDGCPEFDKLKQAIGEAAPK